MISRANPMMAFIGVRSSWDIDARKADFRCVCSWISRMSRYRAYPNAMAEAKSPRAAMSSSVNS